MIKPHGGQLVNCILTADQAENLKNRLNEFKKITLNKDLVQDVKNIARGVYSPLTGFMGQADFLSVIKSMRLVNGLVWPIPIVLDIDETINQEIRDEKQVLLVNQNDQPIALLSDLEIYAYDRDFFAENVFGTTSREHPGVEGVYNLGEYLVGGRIDLIDNTKEIFPEHNFTPEELRKSFQERGWEKIVAFQTRNVPHCGHEYLQLEALKQTDGLLVQPVIGEKKLEDFKDEYIVSAYEILIDKYYPEGKACLSVLPLKMRYAGPREALFHALIRKNYGCTHFIVGRDHAGVGDFYEPFAAQEIFDKFKPEEIGMTILKFPEVVYDKNKSCHAFIDQVAEPERETFSGTRLRQYIKDRNQPPEYLIRPEVYEILVNSNNSLVDHMYKNNKNGKKGYVLWLTGLSGSGKTTIADRLFEKLKDQGLKLERLDGDIVRENLTKDLGFSREDRLENIRRVGFVADLLSKNGVGVIATFISPYNSCAVQ